jgi:hypothetical protein
VLAEMLAHRVQPWLERIAQAPGAEHTGTGEDAAGGPRGDGPPCTACPVCAVLSALRGDRPELVSRLAEHASGLLAVARELLNPPPGATDDENDAPGKAPARTVVQHVPVHHVTVRPAGADKGGAAGC